MQIVLALLITEIVAWLQSFPLNFALKLVHSPSTGHHESTPSKAYNLIIHACIQTTAKTIWESKIGLFQSPPSQTLKRIVFKFAVQ